MVVDARMLRDTITLRRRASVREKSSGTEKNERSWTMVTLGRWRVSGHS